MSREDYDIALIKQIVSDGKGSDTNTTLNRVVRVLVPHIPPGDEITPEMRNIARGVLETLFEKGMIKCPLCGADALNCDDLCFATMECPVTPEVEEGYWT